MTEDEQGGAHFPIAGASAMNQMQSKIMGFALGLIIIMALFPPWTGRSVGFALMVGQERHAGYHPIWEPPELYVGPRINVPLLGLQWVGVCLVAGGFYLVARNPEEKVKTPEDAE